MSSPAAVAGDWFDGKSARRHRATAVASRGDIELQVEGTVIRWAADAFRHVPGVGGTPGQLLHRDGEVFVPDRTDHRSLELFLAEIAPPPPAQRWLHRLESRAWIAVLALLVAVTVGWTAIRFGAPLAAGVIAPNVPFAWEQRLGEQSMSLIDGDLFVPSRIDPRRRQQVGEVFDAVRAAARGGTGWGQAGEAARLEFRDSPRLGANAFALPGATIVITDQMVHAVQNDAELAGVLAHELGHVQHRHGLQSLLAQSVTAIVLFVALGDASSVSSLAVAVPATLIDSAYSRGLEREADDYAINVLGRTTWSPSALADLFERLAPDTGGLRDYLSSHPASAERIRRLRASPR